MKRLVQAITSVAVLAVLGWLGFNWYTQQRATRDPLPLSTLPGDATLIPATPTATLPMPAPDDNAEGALPPTPGRPPVDREIVNPIVVPPAPAPLPALADSDPEIVAGLRELLDHATLQQYFQLDSLARKFVLCVDNLPAGKLAPQNRLVKPVAGSFAVIETAQEIVLKAENYQRYAPLIEVVTALDVTHVARLYRQFYPLLQQAYEDLGYPGRYFNDRLIAVIDHLLAASPLTPPVMLVQPKVFYRYADPALEEASAGHKILFRIGPTHMARVQQWLTALRAQVATEGSVGARDSP